MGIDDIIFREFRSIYKLVERKPTHSFFHLPEIRVRIFVAFDRRENPFPPLVKGKFLQVVFFRWKILDLFELRHGKKFSIETETATMVTALYIPDLTGFIYEQISPMGACVGKAV